MGEIVHMESITWLKNPPSESEEALQIIAGRVFDFLFCSIEYAIHKSLHGVK